MTTALLVLLAILAVAANEWSRRRCAHHAPLRVEFVPMLRDNCCRLRLVRAPKGDR